MQVRRTVLGVAAVAAVLLVGRVAWAQQEVTPLPPVHLHPVPDSSTQQPAPAPAPDASAPATAPAPQEAAPAPAAQPTVQDAVPAAQAPAPAPGDAKKPAPIEEKKKGKKEKEVYSGPTEIIVKDPTPMLDEEGKQRVDTDGKPMFNPGVKQQRDKKGHPLFEDGKPVFQTAKELGYDEHGKKITVKKEKPPKMTPVSISRGTFTVDGVIGKAELNYQIPDLKYIYLYVPGMGNTIVSNVSFPGAKEQKNAFNLKTLTVTVNDHKLELASDNLLLGKKPTSAFVAVDPDFTLPSKFPVVGYGAITKSPYAWPGSKSNAALKGIVEPPPIPKDLQPVKLLTPCATGQMRMPAPPVLPGQVAPEQPCVPIAVAQAALTKLKAQQAANAAAAKAAAASAPIVTPQPAAAPASSGDAPMTGAAAPGAETPAPAPAAPPQ